MNQSSPLILDCTLRDGGYYNAWDFSTELINDYLRAMSALSTDYVEIGFRSLNSTGFKGGCAFSKDSYIEQLDIPKGLKLGVMINASEIINYKKGMTSALSKLFKPASESPLTLVRIACHFHEFENALSGCVYLKEMGYVVGINLMQIADRNIDEIDSVAYLASKYPIDVLYFADSMGGMDPNKTSEVISILRRQWHGPLGIHTHDNMGQALANSLRAIEEGVTWIDGTITGMGRGAGNVQTEYLAIELADRRTVSANITPLLSVINKHFNPLKKYYDWGTNTYYYLAGKYGIHPSFVQEMLSDRRYDDEDRLAVIENLRKLGGKNFSVSTLESGRHFYKDKPIGNWNPSTLILNREVLIIGSGPGAVSHRQALENYIKNSQPIVIALNAQLSVSEDLIDIRAASHPVRILADCPIHLNLPQSLAIPISMLPETVLKSLQGKELLDFGVFIESETFSYTETYCTVPSSLVIGYALGIAASGEASRILLAGFDGYSSDDPRTSEMDKLFNAYQQSNSSPPILSITNTRYKIPMASIYSMI